MPSLFFLKFGHSGWLPLDLLLETKELIPLCMPYEWVQEQWDQLRRTNQFVLKHHRDLADKAALDLLPLSLGDLVLVKMFERGNTLGCWWKACPSRLEKQQFPLSPVYDVVAKGSEHIKKNAFT